MGRAPFKSAKERGRLQISSLDGTTIWIVSCHHEHGVACGVSTALATSVYTKIPCNNLWLSITWIYSPQIHIVLEAVLLKLDKAHSRVVTHSSKLWPYTGNLAKVGDGHSFVSGCSFTRLQYLLYKYHRSKSYNGKYHEFRMVWYNGGIDFIIWTFDFIACSDATHVTFSTWYGFSHNLY